MIELVEQKKIVKLAIGEKGKDRLEKIAESYGMKEWIVATKIFEWFFEQDSVFQRAVLGMLEGLEVDAARVFMERLAERVKAERLAPPGTVYVEQPEEEKASPRRQSSAPATSAVGKSVSQRK